MPGGSLERERKLAWDAGLVRRTVARACCTALVLTLVPASASAATLTVNTAADHDDGVCDMADCTLREAIVHSSAGDTVMIPAGTYTLTLGQLTVSHDLTITGAAAGTVKIDGGGTSRVIDVAANVTVALSGVTVQNGQAPANSGATGYGGGIRVEGSLMMSNATISGNKASYSGAGLATNGASASAALDHVDVNGNGQTGIGGCGGLAEENGTITVTASMIRNNVSSFGGAGCEEQAGTITVTDSTVSGNTASGGTFAQGGGFVQDGIGTLSITRTTMSGNVAQAGGALVEDGGGTLNVTDSTLAGNHAKAVGGGTQNGENGSGGAIVEDGGGPVHILRTTISANTADLSGGGVFSYGGSQDFSISNSTITGNSAAAGGGGLRLESIDKVTIANSTIDSNAAGAGAGQIGVCDAPPTPQACTPHITFIGTIVAAGTPVNCKAPAGTLSSNGSNIDSDGTCGLAAAGDQFGVDPKLGPLADNGGYTQTQALLAGSPAVDAVQSSCPPPATDQRGVARPQGPACDVGAYEAPARRTTSTVISCTPSTLLPGQPAQCTATVTDTDMSPATAPTGAVAFSSSGPGAFTGGPSCGLAAAGGPGQASCTLTYTPSSGGSQTLSANYPGDATHVPSRNSTTLTVTPSPTSTSVSCAPLPVLAGQTIQCTAAVTDTGGTPPTAPSGAVSFSSSRPEVLPYGFPSGSSCVPQATGMPGVATCEVPYRPQGFGPRTISASYPGDVTHTASSGSTSIDVTNVPRTTITSGPGLGYSLPKFTFTSSIFGSTFECEFDGAPFARCASPFTGYRVGLGPHTFSVRAISPGGIADPQPPTRTFTLIKFTSSFSCVIDIPWNIQFLPFGDPRATFGCSPSSGPCPAGSLCTFAASETVTDADQRIAWGGLLTVSFLGVSNFSGSCDAPSGKAWLGPSWRPCPATAQDQEFGPVNVQALCDAFYYDGSAQSPTRGPDTARRVTCGASLTIQPIPPLAAIPRGKNASVFAPGAGVLVVSAGGGSFAVAARASKHKSIAPLRIRVRAAGPVTIPLKLSRKANSTLRRRHKLTLSLRLKFTPLTGAPITRTERVTLRSSQKPSRRVRARRAS